MAKYSFRMPDIGEGIAEAEIVAWHIKVGDTVEEDQAIADVMTDKATVEMESPVAGKVIEINGEPGAMLAIGSILAVFETEAAEDEPDEVVEAAPADATPVKAAEPAKAPATEPEPAPTPPPPPPPPTSEPPSAAGKRVLASPAVRQRAKELSVDLGAVRPAGGDRIRHADLDAFLQYSGGGGGRARGSARSDEEIKVIGMRRRIADNMAAAKRHIPHFTYVEEIDVTDLEAQRAAMNASRGDRPKLTMLPFLISAIAKALSDWPMINATFDDEAGVVTRSGALHLGIATQTDKGLMVPVLRDAQALSVWEMASEIARLADAARTGKAKSEELSGSTLTITSLGPLGGIATTPVINRPEVAIIGPNRIVERPAIVDGELEVRKLMNLSISCDHRVVDGWDAASFVQALKRLIETPILIFAD